MKIKDLTKNPENPRTITDQKKAMLKKALLKFGDLSGVIYNRKTKQLVGGHQRRDVFEEEDGTVSVNITKKYSKKTKTGTVAEGFIEIRGERFSYREVEWDEHTEKAANIAANKGAGEWDDAGLQKWLKDLGSFDVDFDLELTMFSADELFDEGIEVAGYVRKNPDTDVDEDEVPEKAPAHSKLGNIYELGDHRLMCGDSTDIGSVEKLMNGEKAEICFTSPPYNLGENSKLRGYNGDGEDTVYNEKSDHKSQDEYLQFMVDWTEISLKFCKNVFCNVQLLAGNKIAIPRYWMAFHDRMIDIMVWDKEHAQPAAAPRVLNSVFEFIFIFSKDKNPKRTINTGKTFRGDISNIFRLNPVRGGKDEFTKNHGAIFPVAFAQHFIENFSSESIYEPFGGSGTTMIACEKTNRKCFMMEIDPHYCDVIVARWEKYTGLKSKLIRADKKTIIKKAAKQLQKQRGARREEEKATAAART